MYSVLATARRCATPCSLGRRVRQSRRSPRNELLLLFPIVVVPLALLERASSTWRRRVYAATVRLHRGWARGRTVGAVQPRCGSTSRRSPRRRSGACCSAASCDCVFYGEHIGYYDNCFDGPVAEPGSTSRSATWCPATHAIDYIEGPPHARCPSVALAGSVACGVCSSPGTPRRSTGRSRGAGGAPSWIGLVLLLRADPVLDRRASCGCGDAGSRSSRCSRRRSSSRSRPRSPSVSRATARRRRCRSWSPPRSGSWRVAGGSPAARLTRRQASGTPQPTRYAVARRMTAHPRSIDDADVDRRARAQHRAARGRAARTRASSTRATSAGSTTRTPIGHAIRRQVDDERQSASRTTR